MRSAEDEHACVASGDGTANAAGGSESESPLEAAEEAAADAATAAAAAAADSDGDSDSSASIPLCAAAPPRKRKRVAATASGVAMADSAAFRREESARGARLAARDAANTSPLVDPVPEHERAGAELRDRFGGYDGFTCPARVARR